MPGADTMLTYRRWLVRSQERKKGRNENVSALFQLISHAVTGRLPCLSLVPALLIVNVTPRPE